MSPRIAMVLAMRPSRTVMLRALTTPVGVVGTSVKKKFCSPPVVSAVIRKRNPLPLLSIEAAIASPAPVIAVLMLAAISFSVSVAE
jgi:hypothetical protein